MKHAKNQHAVELGKLGGPNGGRARAEALSAEQRSEIARQGGLARGKSLQGLADEFAARLEAGSGIRA